jgi:LPS-assembly lipoprotein
MKKIHAPIYLVLLLLLTACGFTPMHGKYSAQSSQAVQQNLAQISIANIPNREGQFLKNALIDRFYTDGRPSNALYVLDIEPIDEILTDLDITKSSDATRAQLRLNTIINLKDKATNAVVLRRKLTAVTSYNILQSQFTTRVSEQDARENALNDLADQIERQLALYFNRTAP